MASVRFATEVRDLDLVIFDKDGTLIDFDFTWVSRCLRAVDALELDEPARASCRAALLRSIGIDPIARRALPESPVVVGTIAELVTVCATVLYQAGETWTRATIAAERIFRPIVTALPGVDELLPIGDVAGLFRRLADANIAIGILTNDDRAGTAATLQHLGLMPFVTCIVCGDDDVEAKPEPGGLIALAHQAGADLVRTAMVGDAIGDMIAARRAGAAIAVGVLSGAASRAALEPHADVMLETIGALEIL